MPLRISGPWKLLAAFALLSLAPGARAEPPPTNSGQGTRLHGTGRFEHVNIPIASARHAVVPRKPVVTIPSGTTFPRGTVPRVPVLSPVCDSIYLDKGALRGTRKGGECAGADLVGTRFSAPYAGRTVHFEIKEVRAHQSLLATPNPSQAQIPKEAPWEYKVEWRQGEESGALCSTGGGFALAVPHAWSPSGELLENRRYFTFSCLPDKKGSWLMGGGVITKCVDWGYPPWERRTQQITYKGRTTAYVGQVALDFHQACVRMAAADYCGEGRANTLDATPIAFYDASGFKLDGGKVFSGPLRPAAPYRGNYFLEAIWGMDECNELKVLCLGKRRWETLLLEETCLVARNLGVEPGKPVRICEDMTEQEVKTEGLLISYSTFLDRALVRFKSEASPAVFLTTAAVQWRSSSSAPAQYSYGPDVYKPAIEAPGYASQAMIEGALFGPHLPVDFQNRFPLKRLYRCKSRNGENQFLTTDTDNCEGSALYAPDGSHDGPVEGFIYKEGAGIEDNALYLWQSGGRYATSTSQPPGYTKVRLLGYLPSVHQLAEQELSSTP